MEAKDLQTTFESLAKDSKMSLDSVRKLFKETAIMGSETGITESDVDVAFAKTSEDQKSLDFLGLKACIISLAREKKMQPNRLMEKLSKTVPTSGKQSVEDVQANKAKDESFNVLGKEKKVAPKDFTKKYSMSSEKLKKQIAEDDGTKIAKDNTQDSLSSLANIKKVKSKDIEMAEQKSRKQTADFLRDKSDKDLKDEQLNILEGAKNVKPKDLTEKLITIAAKIDKHSSEDVGPVISKDRNDDSLTILEKGKNVDLKDLKKKLSTSELKSSKESSGKIQSENVYEKDASPTTSENERKLQPKELMGKLLTIGAKLNKTTSEDVEAKVSQKESLNIIEKGKNVDLNNLMKKVSSIGINSSKQTSGVETKTPKDVKTLPKENKVKSKNLQTFEPKLGKKTSKYESFNKLVKERKVEPKDLMKKYSTSELKYGKLTMEEDKAKKTDSEKDKRNTSVKEKIMDLGSLKDKKKEPK